MISRAEKKQKRDLMLKLMNENEDWEDNEVIRKQIQSLADEHPGQVNHKSKPVTKLKRHIIHLLKRGIATKEISEAVACTPQYVTVTAGELRNGAYSNYLDGVYLKELTILSLHREGLDVKRISVKMQLSQGVVEEVIEFN